MHAGLIGKNLFERLAGIPVEVHIASEFAYQDPLLTKKPFFILVSQSGETADLRACLVKNQRTPISNPNGHERTDFTLAREAKYFLELYAGPEIAVASYQSICRTSRSPRFISL